AFQTSFVFQRFYETN
nr:RecName: Full=Lectin 29 kDa subunit; AltName: Full=Hemagglutinin 29 kDa subunit [Vigna unguiculata subsp. sesquipedalis]